jgi:hypothetical protein
MNGKRAILAQRHPGITPGMLARREKRFKLATSDVEEQNMATHAQMLKTRRKNQKHRKRLAKAAKRAKKRGRQEARSARG